MPRHPALAATAGAAPAPPRACGADTPRAGPDERRPRAGGGSLPSGARCETGRLCKALAAAVAPRLCRAPGPYQITGSEGRL